MQTSRTFFLFLNGDRHDVLNYNFLSSQRKLVCQSSFRRVCWVQSSLQHSFVFPSCLVPLVEPSALKGPRPLKIDNGLTSIRSVEAMEAFQDYQKILDERYNKHERIVKVSRDVTIESKRVIFLLHRITKDDKTEIVSEAMNKLTHIESKHWKRIAEELQDCDPDQFLRAYSAGLQEYIEAYTFCCYVKEKNLMTLQQLQDKLTYRKVQDSDQDTPAPELMTVPIPYTEYILGVCDLTGEMMRLAIKCVGSGDTETTLELCEMLQRMYKGMTAFYGCHKEFNRKLQTLKQSLSKVESACYTVRVRGQEIPKHMLVNVISDSRVQYEHSHEQYGDEL